LWLRGYVSVAFVCPYSGKVDPSAAVDVTRRLFDLGCDEVALADTVGRATPDDVKAVLDLALADLPAERLALHLHDTGGLALANVRVGLDHGIRVFDGSAGGLGGCPFAPGAPGNLATEALVSFLHAQGFETGVDAAKVRSAVGHLHAVTGSNAAATQTGQATAGE
jgi:hydroxymethylglutaryl-CoA lyase